MGLNYQTVADIDRAQTFLAKHPHMYVWKGEGKHRTYHVGVVTYSPQEILIEGQPTTGNNWYNHTILPEGVTRHYAGPGKEYFSFNDANGTPRYYLVPEGGLRLRKKGGLYTAVNPIKDYRITVDRVAAKKAREDGEEFIKYVTTIWNMVMCPPDEERSREGVDFDKLPDYEDKDAWFKFLLAAKYPRPYWGCRAYQLSTVTAKIRDKFTREALAYSVEVVPDTQMDYTEHWCMIDKLRKAGKLDKYEPKEQRANSKSRAAGSGGH